MSIPLCRARRGASQARGTRRPWPPRPLAVPASGGERLLATQRIEGPLEAAGMRFFGLCEGLEPIGNLVEALLAGGARHAGIHVGVLVRLAGDRGLEIVVGAADRRSGHRI